MHERAGRLARGLRGSACARATGSASWPRTASEWVLLDLAALRLGAVTAGFEPGKFDPDPALLDRYSLAVLFTDRPAQAAGASAR